MDGVLLTIGIRAVDGEVIPVPDLEVGARFNYPAAASTWASVVTDGDGCATFRDRHPEHPEDVCFYVGDERCGTYPVTDGGTIVLEV